MKRKAISALLCGCMILSITACGKKEVKEELVETVSYKSSVTKLADYKGIEFLAGDVEVTDEELNAELDSAIETWTHYEPIDKKVVEMGDIVNIGYISLIDGNTFEDTSNISDTGLNIEIGSNTMIEGFEDALIGAVVGETKTVKLVIPEDFEQESLRGKEITFNVVINSIQQIVSYSLTEENAIKQGYGSLEDFIENCRGNLEEEKYEEFDYNRTVLLVDHILKNSTFNLDKEEVEAEKQEIMEYYYKIADDNEIEKDDYIKNYLETTQEEFEKECLKTAEDNIKYVLSMKAIFEAEGLNIDEYYFENLEEYTGIYSFSDKDSFVNMYGEEQIKIQMMCDKALEILIQHSVPVDKEGKKLTLEDMPVVAIYESDEEKKEVNTEEITEDIVVDEETEILNESSTESNTEDTASTETTETDEANISDNTN